MRKRILRSFATILMVIIFTASLLSATAQQGGTTTYVYDDNGRLHAVISPTGEAVVYEYDAAGNITAIRRLARDSPAILNFSPHEGLPGDEVTFTGVGFGVGVTDVSFNGASAAVVSVSHSKVVATVPSAATTGLVTITTPTGSATTATPFTIVGLRISPSFAVLKFGAGVQFTTEIVPAMLDQSVQWSVEDINGGNTSVGTISTAGVYIAPNTRFSSLTIRATSVADPLRFGQAHVRVSDPTDVQSVFSASVSVQRSEISKVAAFAKAVEVQYGISGGPRAAISSGITVQRGDTVPVSGISNPISVQRDTSLDYAAQAAVSSTMGPYIQSISNASLTRGTAVTVTITGVSLTGATALRFITASGAIDSNVTASNITVSGDGTSLTATISVSAAAAIGSRFVIIATPNGDSIGVDLGMNRITVQ